MLQSIKGLLKLVTCISRSFICLFRSHYISLSCLGLSFSGNQSGRSHNLRGYSGLKEDLTIRYHFKLLLIRGTCHIHSLFLTSDTYLTKPLLNLIQYLWYIVYSFLISLLKLDQWDLCQLLVIKYNLKQKVECVKLLYFFWFIEPKSRN